MQEFHLIEKVAHFNRKRIPERGVQTKDSVCPIVTFSCLVLNIKRQRANASLNFNSKAPETAYTTIRRGQSGQGSLPCSTPLQSRAGTSPGSPHFHRLPPRLGVGSSNRR